VNQLVADAVQLLDWTECQQEAPEKLVTFEVEKAALAELGVDRALSKHNAGFLAQARLAPGHSEHTLLAKQLQEKLEKLMSIDAHLQCRFMKGCGFSFIVTCILFLDLFSERNIFFKQNPKLDARGASRIVRTDMHFSFDRPEL
jgi:hypothetical protein